MATSAPVTQYVGKGKKRALLAKQPKTPRYGSKLVKKAKTLIYDKV